MVLFIYAHLVGCSLYLVLQCNDMKTFACNVQVERLDYVVPARAEDREEEPGLSAAEVGVTRRIHHCLTYGTCNRLLF